jgi:hypothetical protein
MTNHCYYCREMTEYVKSGGLITATHVNGKTIYLTDMGRDIPKECIELLLQQSIIHAASGGLFGDDDPQVFAGWLGFGT